MDAKLFRYLMANARLAALADTTRWTAEEVADVASLISPALSFGEWCARCASLPSPGDPAGAPPPLSPTQEDPDPMTSATMRGILSGEAKELIDLGILRVEEKTE